MRKIFGSIMALGLFFSLQAAEVVLDSTSDDVTGSCPAKDISDLIDYTTHTVLEGKGTLGDGWDADKYVFTPTTSGTVKIKFINSNSANFKVSIDDCQGGGNVVRSIGKTEHEETVIHITEEDVGEQINIGLWTDFGGDYMLNIDFTPDTDEGNENNGGTDNGSGEEIADNVVYEDAEDGTIAGWQNVAPYAGTITNIDVDGNRLIKLTGTTNPAKNRASYILMKDDGSNWSNNQDFIAKWNMQSVDDYEIFFVVKSSDDPTINNYIGYVSKIPVLDGFTFDPATGYWSSGDTVYKEWGRYVYVILDDTSEPMTEVTKDLQADADILGITLTSVEYLFVNVYGDESHILFLDNIRLQKEQDTVENHPPVATAQNLVMNEDTTKDIILSGTDVDGDALIYSVVTEPAHGTFDGTTYTPDENYNGTDSFTFKANDGTTDSEPATVSITVNPVNDAPEAISQNVTVNENDSVDIVLSGTDIDGDALTYSVVTAPAHGTFDGTTYTPDENYNGTDSFTFKANDGTADSEPATVSITVNEVPGNTDTADYTEQNDQGNIVCPGELIDALNGVAASKTVIISGTLNAHWDIDRYSFVPKKDGIIKVTVTDDDGNEIPFKIYSNCYTEEFPNAGGIADVPEECGIITISVGCDSAYENDTHYTIRIRYST